jgi:hypothetical protein
MSHPITQTPPLVGEDADELVEQLKNRCSPEEAKRRQAEAKYLLEKLEGTLKCRGCGRRVDRADELTTFRPDAFYDIFSLCKVCCRSVAASVK